MTPKSEFDRDETERRREEALRRMLSTPHQPHKPKPDSKGGKISSSKKKPSAKA